jgi:streptogramin lyase
LLLVGCNSSDDSNGGTTSAGGAGGTIETIAGTGNKATDQIDADANGSVDAPIPAASANFDTPVDIVLGPDGRLYIMDWNGHKIRALSDDGTVAFVTGTGVEGDACEAALNTDGSCPAEAAEFNHMTDLVFGSDGLMYVSAWHNAKIKRVDLGANAVKDLCGTGNRKFEGDGGTCEDAGGVDLVSFDLPSGVLFDGNGNLFISDQANQVVRRLGTDGIVKTVAGNCPPDSEDDPNTTAFEAVSFGCEAGQGYSGDGGPATAAKLNNELGQGANPQGKIAMDADGNLYIADTDNNVIRKVSPGPDGGIGDGDASAEIITTIAGTGTAGFSGDGGPATSAMLNQPRDVEVAPDGTIYIADTNNNCVRMIDASGTITTVAGRCGEDGAYAGDGGPATLAALNEPYGIELDGDGNLYIADTLNNVIRLVTQ